VLIGFRNRISVLVSWIYAYVFFRRGSRLITRNAEARADPNSALAGLDTAAPRPKTMTNA
jgi:hypothetical protein